MKIREFQTSLADHLNAVEELVQGGCRAIAEDAMNVISEVETQLQTAGGVAITTRPRRKLRTLAQRFRRMCAGIPPKVRSDAAEFGQSRVQRGQTAADMR